MQKLALELKTVNRMPQFARKAARAKGIYVLALRSVRLGSKRRFLWRREGENPQRRTADMPVNECQPEQTVTLRRQAEAGIANVRLPPSPGATFESPLGCAPLARAL
jgi:hypothetical protein